MKGCQQTGKNKNKNKENIKTDLPDTDNINEKVTRESRSKHLRHDEHVGSQCGLQHNRHVGGIEQFDRIGTSLSTELVALHWDLNMESLKIDDNCKNDDCGD